MKKEIDIAFALLRGALDGTATNIGKTETNQWWGLFRLLQQNHVSALVSEVFSQMSPEEKPPREVLIPWLTERKKAESWYLHQSKVQQKIVDLMQHNNIDTLVLKGTHLAQLYPHPELREFGDIDLYFYDKHDEADTLVKKQLMVNVDNQAHHHTKYNYQGVTVESHYDFVNRHYPRSNRTYEAMLKELAPSHTFEVLFLLRHMACHFAASRITLRDLVDWGLTCRALGATADWTVIGNAIKQYGMEPFASALNSISERRLGIKPPLQLEPDPKTVDALEHDIVLGNMANHNGDGLARLGWKMRRWHALAWKRRLVYSDSPFSLWLTSRLSHTTHPRSILHKM